MTIPYKTIGRVSSESLDEQEFLPQKKHFLSRFLRFFRIRGFDKLTTSRRVAVLIAIALVIASGYIVYERYFNLTPTEKAQKELAATISSVSRYMILPDGDEPVLATVSDAAALIKQQTFFTGAVNGDQLLLFPRNLKAVLYSPSRDKIVNVGPIQQSNTGSAPQAANNAPKAIAVNTADQKTNLTIEVRNGSGKTGYAAQVAGQISVNAGYSVIKTADAMKKDYEKTIVFNRSKDADKKSKIEALVNTFNAELVSELPSGEKNTDADVLVILGGK